MQKGHPKSSWKGVDMQSTSAVTKIWGRRGDCERRQRAISQILILLPQQTSSPTHTNPLGKTKGWFHEIGKALTACSSLCSHILSRQLSCWQQVQLCCTPDFSEGAAAHSSIGMLWELQHSCGNTYKPCYVWHSPRWGEMSGHSCATGGVLLPPGEQDHYNKGFQLSDFKWADSDGFLPSAWPRHSVVLEKQTCT